MTWMEVLSTIIMLGGCFFVVVAAVGTVRLPDVYCRSHALGKAMTLGIMLLLIGYGLHVPEASWLKLGVILLFQFVTIPVASHLFCLIAYRKGVRGMHERETSGGDRQRTQGPSAPAPSDPR